MQSEVQQKQKMNFIDYFETLTRAEKVSLRDKVVPSYMQLSTFYQKLARNSWTKLEIEKLESITGLNFIYGGATCDA
jgi:hypothetical protein